MQKKEVTVPAKYKVFNAETAAGKAISKASISINWATGVIRLNKVFTDSIGGDDKKLTFIQSLESPMDWFIKVDEKEGLKLTPDSHRGVVLRNKTITTQILESIDLAGGTKAYQMIVSGITDIDDLQGVYPVLTKSAKIRGKE